MIGELNQRARILSRATAPDGAGGYTETWDTAATVWAKLEALSGDEDYVAQAIRTRARYRIAVRRHPAIEPARRVVIGTRTFRILDVLDDGSPTLTLLCEELP
ncbi:MAG: phage head closure protein [Rhizomicrobium sp.]